MFSRGRTTPMPSYEYTATPKKRNRSVTLIGKIFTPHLIVDAGTIFLLWLVPGLVTQLTAASCVAKSAMMSYKTTARLTKMHMLASPMRGASALTSLIQERRMYGTRRMKIHQRRSTWKKSLETYRANVQWWRRMRTLDVLKCTIAKCVCTYVQYECVHVL